MILIYQADQEEDVRTTTQCRSAKNNEGLHPPVVFVGAVVIGTHISYPDISCLFIVWFI